jgi:hypothetical protein
MENEVRFLWCELYSLHYWFEFGSPLRFLLSDPFRSIAGPFGLLLSGSCDSFGSVSPHCWFDLFPFLPLVACFPVFTLNHDRFPVPKIGCEILSINLVSEL